MRLDTLELSGNAPLAYSDRKFKKEDDLPPKPLLRVSVFSGSAVNMWLRQQVLHYTRPYSADVAALLLLLGILCGSNMMVNHRRKPFLLCIVLTPVIILSEAGTMLTEGGDPGLRGISSLFNILGFAPAPVLPLSFITISDMEILREHKWLLLPTLINGVHSSVFHSTFRI